MASEHLCLHFRIFRACVWLLDLLLLHNWDVNCSFSELPQFSVPLALLAPASRLRFPPLGQGMEHVALPLLSARFELVGTWRLRCTATGTSTDLSLYCTWATSIVETRRYLPLHVHGDVDNFVDELHTIISRFFLTVRTAGTCLCVTTGK